MASEKEPRRLGRGLDALIRGVASTGKPDGGQPGYQRIPLVQIRPNPLQPRREFKPAELEELQSSLASSGLLQPITVRPAENGKGYELIAGERRLRAANNLGWKDIAAIVRKTDDQTLLAEALIENLQRTDLNAIEEAEGYKRLADEFGLTQQQISDLVGKDRSTIANLLRVLNLPDLVRGWVRSGELSLGHARALLGIGDEKAIQVLAAEIVDRGHSVRQTELLVRSRVAPKKGGKKKGGTQKRTAIAETASIEERVRKRFQTDVSIQLRDGDKGVVGLNFYSAEDLERILALMGVAPE